MRPCVLSLVYQLTIKIKTMKQNPILLQSIVTGEYLMDVSGKMSNENTDLEDCMNFKSVKEAEEYAESKGWHMLEPVELNND